ncbi:hypothetical protein DPEC_G00294040 [Dallia pectoralis]|uniref:Uncharacterized protein n=1 Tax=Dallia pectoralis TaxID=75939 RepID=A0ACC2FIL3_DALPE|nr:hypothetical protein DPEC_G00294040 [Dallia pectoralis]
MMMMRRLSSQSTLLSPSRPLLRPLLGMFATKQQQNDRERGREKEGLEIEDKPQHYSSQGLRIHHSVF